MTSQEAAEMETGCGDWDTFVQKNSRAARVKTRREIFKFKVCATMALFP